MIKIIAGVYGHYTGGRVVPKDATAAPFELTPEQEARLVSKGIAKYVDAPVNAPEEETEETAEKALEDMTKKELEEVAAEYGLTFKNNATKADMLAAIKEAQEVPDAEDDLDAPDLDPAAAVVE